MRNTPWSADSKAVYDRQAGFYGRMNAGAFYNPAITLFSGLTIDHGLNFRPSSNRKAPAASKWQMESAGVSNLATVPPGRFSGYLLVTVIRSLVALFFGFRSFGLFTVAVILKALPTTDPAPTEMTVLMTAPLSL